MNYEISNKIITVDMIKKVAYYLEDIRQRYNDKVLGDKEKNNELRIRDQRYEFKSLSGPRLEFAFGYRDNTRVKKYGIEYFEEEIKNPYNLLSLEIIFCFNYSNNMYTDGEVERSSLELFVDFHEERVHIYDVIKTTDYELENAINDIVNIIQSGKDRYDKTIKHREIRIQSFCFAIGTILSYIAAIFIYSNIEKMPEVVINILNNKKLLIILQLIFAVFVGNIFGKGIITNWYSKMLPKQKYVKNSARSGKSLYIDDVENYTSKNEILIGNNVNNLKNRELIEKSYKISSILCIIQILISAYMWFTIK